ncbi:MAG: hypothetical protein WCK53_10080 [Methanomicrobiales archaeon]
MMLNSPRFLISPEARTPAVYSRVQVEAVFPAKDPVPVVTDCWIIPDCW